MDQLALGLIIALVPLILAGLSIATFMQPRITRKALVVLIILNIIYFFGVYTAEMGAKQGYTKSLAVISSDTITAYSATDSWTQAKMDSIKIYMEMRNSVNSEAYQNIVNQQQADLKYTENIRLYCYISLAVFIVFLILSYLFETMKLGEKLNAKANTFDVTRYTKH